MKSLKAGLNFTLKMGIFCPNNGEGLKRFNLNNEKSFLIKANLLCISSNLHPFLTNHT
jgi:hypothetical protein